MPWLVYKHTSPSNKVYIGVTSKENPNERWANGNGYSSNEHFTRAIRKYGWKNFDHEIIKSGITEDEAYDLEKQLIYEYNSLDQAFGYNMCPGGKYGFGKYLRTEEIREKNRKGILNHFNNGYTPCWITNGDREMIIDLSTDSISDGWCKGRLPNLDTYIYKGDVSKKINHDELSYYLSNGWCKGRPKNTHKSISKSRQSYTYYYKGIKFNTAKEVSDYLNSNGYPSIVSSTITSILSKGKSQYYPNLLQDLYRIRNEGVKI